MVVIGVIWTLSIVQLICDTVLACPTSICTCSARGTVICSSKRLERIPYFAREPGRVYEEIDLGDNEIFAVPPYAFDGVQVKSLVLRHNPLIGVSPRAFAGLSASLRRVDLSDCQLPVLHWAVFRQLAHLADISLARNGLFAVPRGLFVELSAARNLSLAGNRLAVLRRGVFTGLRNVRRLDLSGNVIATIDPGTFEACRRLISLDLSDNRLRDIDDGAFRGLENVRYVSLANNELASAKPTVRALVELDLSGNNLTVIVAQQFFNSPRLERINLARNVIWNVSVDAFDGLTNLRSVYLDRNRLRQLDRCLAVNLGHQVELSVTSNPVLCSCDEDGGWVNGGAIAMVVGKCWEPPALRGLELTRFNATSCPSSRQLLQSHCRLPVPPPFQPE